jgi:hypothetical protein
MSQYVYLSDGSQGVQMKRVGVNTVSIQTHNAASILTNTSNTESVWHLCDGYSELAIRLANDAATGSYIDVQWSDDGSNVQGAEITLGNNTNQNKVVRVNVAAKYFRISVRNTDAATHVISAWAYLKA